MTLISSRDARQPSTLATSFNSKEQCFPLESVMLDTFSGFEGKSNLPTNVTLLLDDNPEAFDGSNLFDQFHELWRAGSNLPIELPLQYTSLCTLTAQYLPKLASFALYRDGLPNVKNTLELLNLEKDTWALVSALFTDRFATEIGSGTDPVLNDFSNVQHSEREIVKLLYERDSGLREIQMFIDWLERRVREHIEQVAERYECLFNQTTTWENTAHAIEYLSPSELKARKLPSELHPDAAYCTGSQWDPKDQTDNDRYLNYLFLCIRGGDMQRAQRLCMQRGEFWRAISLEGWRPFHFSHFVSSPTGVPTQLDDDMEEECADISWQSGTHIRNRTQVAKIDQPDLIMPMEDELVGNANRVLYKTVSWWNAENPTLHPYDRAIYASLSGNLSVLTRTLPASWTDLAWAHCRAMVEARVDSALRRLLHTGPRANTLPTLHPYDRAIYASLSGNLSVLTRTLPASWTDLAWAHCRAMVEARVDSALRRLLHTGPRANTLALTGKTQPAWPLDGGLTLPESAWAPKEWTIADAFTKIDASLGWSALGFLQAAASSFHNLSMETMRRSALIDFLSGDMPQLPAMLRPSEKGLSDEPALSALLYCIFYATQQVVMLREYEDYLVAVANVMPHLVSAVLGGHSLCVDPNGLLLPPMVRGTSGTQNTIVCHCLRFLAHFVLFLRAVEPGIPDEPFAQILKAYLSVLIVDHRADLVAHYTASLPTAALRIQWYASFLTDITDAGERERCLTLAVSAGFDVQRITRAVVRILRERHFVLLLPEAGVTDSRKPDRAQLQLDAMEKARLASILQSERLSELSEADKMRVLSLDWLFYDPRQRGEALVVANSLLRTFIAIKCLKAAEQILDRLPSGTLERAKIICEDSGSPNWLVNAIREHECLVLYLESRDAFADWFKHAHSNRPVPPPELNTSGTSHLYGSRGFTERLQAEESRKTYEARLERWRHVVRQDTEVAAEKLLALLTYPSPGWLVDVNTSSGKDTVCSPQNQTGSGEEFVSELGDYDNEEDEEDRGLGQPVCSGDAAGQSTSFWAAPPNDCNVDDLGDDPSSRRLQMQVLRESCLTDTVFLLVDLYRTAGMHQQCTELANYVAAKEHELFKLFSKVQLRQLFDRINESLEQLVATVGDPLGYPTEMADRSERLVDSVSIGSKGGDMDMSPRSKQAVPHDRLTQYLRKSGHVNRQELITSLMNTDLRELGSSWIADNRKKDQLETGDRIVQIVRIRNIAIPLVDEDSMLASSSTVSQSGPRLLRLALTDGRTTVMALDVDNNEKLSLNTPPGTKLRLMGTIPIHLGFLVLRKKDFQVLGGNVPNLIKEWTMTKLAKSCEGRGIGGGHPFVPFGSEEAAALVKTESRFLQSLQSSRDRGK
ncbi:hypothetical protein AHF37_05969 [Paragonimus kellicotti]|nr:hypothetical protein AHF37_05969 [Paragonimus kellicotti]